MSNKTQTQKSAAQNTKSFRLSAMVQVDCTRVKSAAAGAEDIAKLLGQSIDATRIVARGVIEGRFDALSLTESKSSGSLTTLVSLPVEGGLKCSVRITLINSSFEGARTVLGEKCGIEAGKLGIDASDAIGQAAKAGLFSALKSRTSQKGNVTASASVRDLKVALRAVEPRTKAETKEEKRNYLLSQLS